MRGTVLIIQILDHTSRNSESVNIGWCPKSNFIKSQVILLLLGFGNQCFPHFSMWKACPDAWVPGILM
jgi:hypothetical protein